MAREISRRKFVEFSFIAGAAAATGSLTMAGCSSDNSSATEEPTERTITDDAGRSLTLPASIEKVYCAVPTSEAMVVGLAPEKLVGWVFEHDENELKYLPDYLSSLPVLGGWMGQKVTANMESIIKAAPDVIIYCWTFTSADDDISDSLANAEQIQSDAGVPCIVVDGSLDKIAEKYRWLGDILGVSDRGEELATYVDEKLGAVAEAVAKVPDSEVPTLYYAEGNNGIATDPALSGHTQVIDFCNVKNVAVTDGFDGPMGQGLLEVSMENIVSWNPEIILVSGSTPDNYDLIQTEPAWSEIQAVKDGKIYQTPMDPFPWFDRPPCSARVLGCQWFANLIYPTYYDVDIREDIKEYFNVVYKTEITDTDVDSLIAPNPTLP